MPSPMSALLSVGILVLAIAIASGQTVLAQDSATPAKILFGQVTKPSDADPTPVGSYAKGCLAGAVPLPITGPAWQVMRLSRNRNWGMPELVSFLEKFGTEGRKAGDWPGLLIGDMSQPRGGPMATGHASHQIGLDADIVYYRRDHREMDPDDISGFDELFVKAGRVTANFDAERCFEFVKALVSTQRVDRIFVDPKVKRGLCDYAKKNGEFSELSEPLRRLRPYPNHANHMHVRLSCPVMSRRCVRQKEPPPGSGCSNLRVAPGRWDG